MLSRRSHDRSRSRSRSRLEHPLPRIEHLLITRRPTVAASILIPVLIALPLNPDSLQALYAAPPLLLHILATLPARVIFGVALGESLLVLLSEVGLEVVFAGEGTYA